MSDYFDVTVIPDFKKRCRRAYLAFRQMTDLALINRIGEIRFCLYKAPNEVEAKDVPENVEMHTKTCVDIAFVIRYCFIGYLGTIDFMEVYETMVCHDIPERRTGDSPDNNTRDEDEKEAQELRIFRTFLYLFPRVSQSFQYSLFKSFQDRNDDRNFCYCIDKLAFLWVLGWYKHYEVEGSALEMKNNKKMSDADDKRYRIAKSDSPIDIIAIHYAEQIRDNYYKPLFLGLTEAMYFVEGKGEKMPEHIRSLFD